MRVHGAVVLALACSSSAAVAAERHALDLPAGRLGDSLATLGRQARISVALSDPALANERVSAVRGQMTAEQALARLLRGHDAALVRIDAATFRIVRRPPAPRKAQGPPAPKPRPAPPELRRTAPLDPVEQQGEIIVTASRREVPLRSYAGSAIVVDGDDVAFAHGPRGTEALVQRLPSLTSTHLGPGRNKLFIRGMSESNFNGPTQSTVGQYFGETRLNYNAPDPDLRLYDIDRVEVLAGPQGTLYGAGSLGGIVRIVPRAPQTDRFEAAGSAGGALTAHGEPGADFAGVVNMPLESGRGAARLSLYGTREGGYIDDSQRGLENVNRVGVGGGRLAVRAVPDEAWTLDLGVTGQQIDGEDAQFAERGQGRLTRRSAISQPFENTYWLTNAAAVREWGDYRFVASAGVVRQRLEERYDATVTGIPPTSYDLTTSVRLYVGEARVAKRSPDGTGWVLGLSLLRNRSDQSREVDQVTSGKYLRNRVENDIDEAALYGETGFRVLPRVTATLGGRVVASRVAGSGFAFRPGFPLPPSPERATRTHARFLPAAALSAEANDDIVVYARYQESFRQGGLAVSGDDFMRFRSDKLAAVELGARYGSPGADRFDAAAAIVYTRWTDIQADTIDSNAEPTTANVGDARLYTLDLSLGWRPVAGVELEASTVLNDSRIKLLRPELLASGSAVSLPGVARFNGRLAAHYSFAASNDWDLRLSLAGRYTGRSNLGAGDFLRRPQGDWLDLSLLVRADAGQHSFTLGVTNLLDTAANRFALGSPFALADREHTTPVRPRTIRLAWELGF